MQLGAPEKEVSASTAAGGLGSAHEEAARGAVAVASGFGCSVAAAFGVSVSIDTENEGMMCAMCAVLRPNDRLNVSSTRESWVSDGGACK